MKYLFVLTTLFLSVTQLTAQKFITKTATIQFDASGPMEEITSKNSAVACILNQSTGEIQLMATIKSFVFEKSLMQDHFNENYMESEKFPKATFKGMIENNNDVNYAKDGSYKLKVVGKLTMHGVTKDVSATGKINIKNGEIYLESQFVLLCSDYDINIPNAVNGKVSNQIKINVRGNLTKM